MLLREWSIDNFKSFGELTSVRLAPLTLIAGANSSGKSSFLQSILLLKQTVQYGAPVRTLALNTPLLKLGTLRDVISSNATSPDLLIGFSFDVEVPTASRVGTWARALTRHMYYSDPLKPQEISGYLRWRVAHDEVLPEQPSTTAVPKSLMTGALRVLAHSASGQATEVGITYEQIGAPELEGRHRETLCRASVDPRTNDEVTAGVPDGNVTGAYLYHFTPNWLTYTFDAQKKDARDLAKALCRSPTLILGERDIEHETVSAHIVAIANEVLVRHNKPALELEATPAKELQLRLAPVFHRLPGFFGLAPTADNSERAQLEERLTEAFLEETLPYEGSDVGQPRTLGSASDFLREFFRFGVRYLGPLRDQPRAFYPWEDSQSSSDVGFRGEHTAAVLRELGGARIEYIPSSCFSKNGTAIYEKSATLLDAVVDWLNYLGLATDVRAWEHGLQGDALVVKTEGLDRDQFLTSVGVGVSQVLPIVVSALIAERTSLLVFEQPELHLQPKVQARLADFFFSICLAQKQCVLETHSEHLINRVRRRIAEDANNVFLKNVAVYFTERTDGNTKMKPVELNEYGTVLNWPRDFFDQSEMETEQILTAAARKLKNSQSQE